MTFERQYTSGRPLYGVVRDPTNRPWNGSSFESETDGNWAAYAVAMAEQGTSGFYVGTFPAGITDPGCYKIIVYDRQGGSPAISDKAVGQGNVQVPAIVGSSVGDLSIANGPLTAQPALYKTPGSVLPVAISFVSELTSGDTLTGTPTITVSPSGPIVSSAALNTQALKIEIEGNEHWALLGQAVLCQVAGGSVNDDGSARAYSLLVTVSSLGGATWDRRPVPLIVSND